MTEVAYEMYHRLQNVHRAKDQDAQPSELAALGAAYSAFRLRAAVLQKQLETYYKRNLAVFRAYANKSDVKPARDLPDERSFWRGRSVFVLRAEPWTYWHAMVDLLTLDYFHVAHPELVAQTEREVRYHIGLPDLVPLRNDEEILGETDHEIRIVLFTSYMNLAIASVLSGASDEDAVKRSEEFTEDRSVTDAIDKWTSSFAEPLDQPGARGYPSD
jgi:hypothetical protein